jgi:serine/threonine-protein kinase SRPK3/serine/threonine-protein kinase SRPK1
MSDDSEDDEGTEDYKVGGYHFVHMGDIYNNRYKVNFI